MKHHQKHRILFMVICTLTLLFLAGCGYTAEEKAAMRQYERQGTQNALAYIEEKYGFGAKVLEVTCDKVDPSPIPDFSPSPNGSVFVEMEYDNEKFRVYISGEEKTTNGMDNYQKDEIQSAVCAVLKDEVGAEPQELFLCYGYVHAMNATDEENAMAHNYFDGGNLEEVLGEYGFSVVCSYIDKDLEGVNTDAVLQKIGNGNFLLVSYRSEDAFHACDNHDYNVAGYPISQDIEENGVFIKEYYAFDDEKDNYVENYVGTCDGFYYLAENTTDVSLEKTQMDNPSNWNGRGFLGAKQVLDAYRITTDADWVALYIPKSLLRGVDIEETGIALQYKSDGQTVYQNAVVVETGNDEYLTTTIYLHDYNDMKFTVLVSTE